MNEFISIWRERMLSNSAEEEQWGGTEGLKEKEREGKGRIFRFAEIAV